MPTTIEIKYPMLKYCQEYDVHCFCPKCSRNRRNCNDESKVECPADCETCKGESLFTWRFDDKFTITHTSGGCKRQQDSY